MEGSQCLKPLARWDMSDYIETLEDARFHLEAAIDEDPGDGSLIRAVLSAIARSQSMSALARDSGAEPGESIQGTI